MDINTLRIIVTLVSFIAFVGIIAWTLNPRNRAGFEVAERLPFQEEDKKNG